MNLIFSKPGLKIKGLPGPILLLLRLPGSALSVMSGPRDSTMEHASALPVTAGALIPFSVYATSHLERLGSAPSRRDLSLSVCRSLEYAQPIWAQHSAPWRRAGHDGGTPHLGSEPESSCPRALPDPRRRVDRHR